jgi:phage terminase small subunit
MPLTLKQKAFADFYIETGNASEAARKAGYSQKCAQQIGAENLTKPLISAYIKQRLAEIEAGRIASADEVMKFYSAVLRGEVKDQFGLDAQLADRLNAGKELMKRFERIEGRGESDALQRAREILGGIDGAID